MIAAKSGVKETFLWRLTRAPTRDEAEKPLMKLKAWRAAGLDGVAAQFLRSRRNACAECQVRMFNGCSGARRV